MGALASDIVDRAIAHARTLAAKETYDWLTARAALKRILADLETRYPADPGLARLRLFIAERDRTFASRPQAPTPPTPSER
jgi:hypothetical protein